MKKKLSAIFGIPKTIWFNFRYLPFKIAIKLPILLAHNVRIRNCYRGGIHICKNDNMKFLIKLGFHLVEPIDNYSSHTIIDIRKGGILEFKGDGHIGIGAILYVGKDAKLILGHKFAISGTTYIVTKNRIEFGDNVQLSYNGLIMDSDAHKIYNVDGNLIGNSAPIIIESNVWVAPNVTVLKGSWIPQNCIIASQSLVNKKFDNPGYIIGGIPAKELKPIQRWEI